jgi:hypothetical protein
MLLIVGPGLLIAIAGGMLGIVVAPFMSGRGAALFGSWVVWGVVLSTAAAVLTAFQLPRTVVMNGPIGATCPDMASTPADVLTAFAVASVATAVITVASVVAEGWSHAATGATFVRFGCAVVVPYVALGAWLAPRLCDYS